MGNRLSPGRLAEVLISRICKKLLQVYNLDMSIQKDAESFGGAGRKFGLVYEETPEEFWLDKSEWDPRIGDVALSGGKEGRIENIGG
ncbi:MAG: hypothetical protein IKT06_03795, partial [Aeriscardovia sp.]|nr:hypothetical protein [Aeriscardovia sp.]